MVQKPVIGMICAVDAECVTHTHPTYTAAIEQAGGTPITLPYTQSECTAAALAALCDAFLFTGGVDIDPSYYGEERKPTCGQVDAPRDETDFLLLKAALATKKPILGICRGIQLINVALGGTLYQDLPSEIKTDISHRQTEPQFEHSHEVVIREGTPLFDLLGVTRIPANSFHHQAVKVPGKGLCTMAEADDGVIEALYLKGEAYLRAYQWHPERLCAHDAHAAAIFADFIQAAAKDRAKSERRR